MSIVPFRWLGTSRKARICAALQTHATSWAQAWCTSSLPCFVEALLSTPADYQWHVIKGAAGEAIVGLAMAGFEALGCRLIGAAAADGRGLAAGLGRQALDRFFFPLVHGSDEMKAIEHDPARQDPRQGWASLVLTIGDVPVALQLDSALCARLAPPSSAPSVGLVARREAILQESVTLGATLDLGQTDLVSVSSLRPGDVIKTDVALDAHLCLQAGATNIANATLIAQTSHRACRITHTRPN